MKSKLIGLFVLLAVAVLALPTGAPSGKVTLAWDYPTNELSTNLTFLLYHSEDVTVPLTNWAVLSRVIGTNTITSVTISPGSHFFTMTASNFWGESDFSNVASTPPLPRNDVKLHLTRGD